MVQVNFYSLSSKTPESRQHFACRLAEKAFSLGHQIYIQTDSEEQARSLDDLMWQFNPASFVPHALHKADQVGSVAVLIADKPPSPSHTDVLINLATSPCEAHAQFSRINEIITSDEESLQQGRSRYRYYKDQGYAPETFKL